MFEYDRHHSHGVSGPVVVAFALAACVYLAASGTRVAGPDPYARLRGLEPHTLERATTLHGVTLPAGSQVTLLSDAGGYVFPNGMRLVSHADDPGPVEVVSKATVVVAGVPVTGTFHFDGQGLSGTVTLASDATIEGLPCSSGSADFERTLESGFGRTYLSRCTMSAVADIKSVPCSGGYQAETGSVTCTLARDRRAAGILFRAGTFWTQESGLMAYGDNSDSHEYVDAVIAAIPEDDVAPSLRVLGHRLKSGDAVVFDANSVGVHLSESLQDAVVRRCELRTLLVDRKTGSAVAKNCPELPKNAVTL